MESIGKTADRSTFTNTLGEIASTLADAEHIIDDIRYELFNEAEPKNCDECKEEHLSQEQKLDFILYQTRAILDKVASIRKRI